MAENRPGIAAFSANARDQPGQLIKSLNITR